MRVFNDRGACLAGVQVNDCAHARAWCSLPPGAWYDPLVPGEVGTLDKHGNPNVLTLDRGSSGWRRAARRRACLVEVERWNEPLPPVTAHRPPPFVQRGEIRATQEGDDR